MWKLTYLLQMLCGSVGHSMMAAVLEPFFSVCGKFTFEAQAPTDNWLCWDNKLFNRVWLYLSGGCCTCWFVVVVVAGGCCTGWPVARGNPALPVVTEAIEPLLPVWQEVMSLLVRACALWKMSRLWPIGSCWELKSSILTNLSASKLSYPHCSNSSVTLLL